MDESSPTKGYLLLVHANPESTAGLIALLADGAHRVRAVATGHAALDEARDHPPDLILLSRSLPDLDGYEVCTRLGAGKETASIPILFLLDSMQTQDVARLFAVGGTDYLREPCQKAEVLSRIESHLALNKTRQRLANIESQLQHEANARQQLEIRVQAAEASGLSLVENLSEVIYTADTQGILTYISPSVEAFLGYHPSEMMGRHVSEFIHKDDLAQLEERLQHLLDGGDATSEYRALTKSGEMRWMRTSSQPAIDHGHLIGVQGVLTDSTAHRQAEDQIRQQNEFLTDVLESLTHPFYVVDVNNYTIQLANTATSLSDQAGAATCYALTHGRSSPCGSADHPCPIDEIVKTGHPVTLEHIHYDAAGNPRHVEVHSYPLFDGEGKVVRAIEYTLDVTERKEAERAMRESEENWRSLTEYSPDYIMLLDQNATILFTNHTLPELSREQVIGTSFYDYALQEYRQATQECFERVLNTGFPDQFESIYHDGNGVPTVFESHVGPVMRDGQVWGLTVRSTDITERRQAEEALQILTHELGERVKELNCLYGISRLAAQEDITLPDILQGTVELFPPAFQYPEVTCARIILEDKEFKTHHFRETAWRLDSTLLVRGEEIGTLEVYYLEEKPESDDGPFLKEERLLISAVAERLGRIVERLRVEEAVRQSERKYRQLLEALQEGIWVIDQNACTTLVNPRMAEMLGYTEEEMLGQHLYSFMDERGIEITERNLRRREQGIQEQHDFEFLRKDGSRIYTLLETSPIYDDDGNYAGGIAGLQDITERKHAEEALRESEARWRSVTENSPDHVIILDADLNIQFLNYSSPGLDVEELIGTPLYTYVSEERQAEIRQILQNVLDSRQPAGYETDYVTPDGDTIYYESRVVPRILDGQVIGLAVNARDITERKQAEEALQEAAASTERNRLARDLHDSVTQALFSASLVAEVLPQVWRRDPELGEQGLEELRLLTRGALAEMRTMLLELRPTALVETSLNDLVWQLTEAITGRAQLAVQFDIEPIPTLPPDVHVTFYRVAQESLHNVLKHAEAEQVTVSLRVSPPAPALQAGDWRGQAILHISDNGQGIAHDSALPGQLGLSIMHERAEAIGAMLTVEGRPGRGTQVTLVWSNT